MDTKILQKEVALRRAALFNVKVRNMGVKDILKNDYVRERELEDERDKLAVILSTTIGSKEVDELLLKPKKYREDKKNEKFN